MEITQAYAKDLPQMIDLLKSSLGEGLMPKSEAFFLWKHEQNPFGKSKVLLAKEGEKIVGLRAFMYWKWVTEQKTITAVRAVDTATDPAFQGKGIFKKLTLQAVHECKDEGVDMVFNSPNPMSMQGYLKMGWTVAGRMPLQLGIGSLVPRLYSTSFAEEVYATYPVSATIEKLDKKWALPFSSRYFHTPVNYTYLNWRYSQCPTVQYASLIEPGKFGVIFRLKKIKQFIEFRICEIWVEPGSGAYQQAAKSIGKLVRKIRPAFISCAPSPMLFNEGKNILGLWGPFKKGPVTTIRPLSLQDLHSFTAFNQWQPSVGSMELF